MNSKRHKHLVYIIIEYNIHQAHVNFWIIPKSMVDGTMTRNPINTSVWLVLPDSTIFTQI